MKPRRISFIIFLFLALGAGPISRAQLQVTSHREGWSTIPPQAQRRGFYFQRSVSAQMDSTPELEEVVLYGCDNGHWPEFDLFRQYVAVVSPSSGKVLYLGEPVVVDHFNMEILDRNSDGLSEVYYSYIKKNTFRVGDTGYSPSWVECNDCIGLGEGVPSSVLASAQGDRHWADSLRLLRSRDPRIVPLIENPVAKDNSRSKGRIRVIMIAGQDGSHWWRGACEAMRLILENTSLFTVDYAFTPGWDGDMSTFRPDFSKYDLAVIDYGGKDWSDETKRAFEKFVGDGGGAVFLHSSVIPHENWPAWNEMTGLGAWNMRDEKWGPRVYMLGDDVVYDYTPGWAGYHGLQHQTLVRNRNLQHPIVAGLPEYWRHYKDEIYLELRGPARNLTILATTHDRDKDFPVFWTVEWGKGRVFVDVQGHCGEDPQMIYSMTCTGFQVTFARGCEWAARGTVTLPAPSDFPTRDTYTLRPDFKAPEK